MINSAKLKTNIKNLIANKAQYQGATLFHQGRQVKQIRSINIPNSFTIIYADGTASSFGQFSREEEIEVQV